jgi:hypothetical protein
MVRFSGRRSSRVPRRAIRGAWWFYAIAVLSAINGVLVATSNTGHTTTFVAGLGFVEVADEFVGDIHIGSVSIPLCYVLDTAAVGLFFIFGRYAARGRRWAFIIGGLLYLLDTTTCFASGGLLALGIHVLALFNIGLGFAAVQDLCTARADASAYRRR